MNKETINNIKKKASKIDNIRAIIKIEPPIVSSDTEGIIKEDFFICELVDLKSYYLLIDMFTENQEILLKQERYNEEPFEFFEYQNIFKGESKLKIVFIGLRDLDDYLKNFDEYSFIVDKDKLSKSLDQDVDTSIIDKLDPDSFYKNAIGFFIGLTDVAIALARKDYIEANYLYDRSKAQLLDLTKIYMCMKKQTNVGLYGKNIYRNIEQEYYDQFIGIFRTSEYEHFWTAIFTSASLYRRLGLEIARTKNISYPKKEDIDSMEYLKFLYTNFGRK